MTRNYLIQKLYELSIYNPNFGRKLVLRDKDKQTIHSFNMDAPSFTMNEAYNYHLHKPLISSDDESDEDEYDDNNSVS